MSEFNDHDLLIELRTEMRGVRVDIKDLKDGTTSRLDDLESHVEQLERYKASKVDMDKVVNQQERMNTRQNLMVGGLIVLNAILPFIIKYLFEK